MYVVYRIVHQPTGRYYLGKTAAKKWNAGYMGSGVAWESIINAHSVSDFRTDTLCVIGDEKAAYEYERFVIGNLWLIDPLCKNQKPGGEGGTERGRRHSEETRRKLSKAGMGRTAWNKGKPTSEETKKKISAVMRDNPLTHKPKSEEHKRKIAASLKGNRNSIERKFVNAMHGSKNPSKRPEVRAKMSRSLRGVPKSEEHKRKISEAVRRYYAGKKNGA